MKRLAMIFVCLVVLLGVAFAESIDLSGYDDVELFALHQSIEDEMLARGLKDSVELIPGTYIVGEDIDPGVYKISCVSILDRELLYLFMHNIETGDKEAAEAVELGCFVRLRVKEGCKLKVQYGIALAELIEE